MSERYGFCFVLFSSLVLVVVVDLLAFSNYFGNVNMSAMPMKTL